MGRKKQGGQKPLVGVRMSETEQAHLDQVAAALAERTGGTPNRADVFRLGIKLVESGSGGDGATVLPLLGVVSAGEGAGEEYPAGTMISVGGLWPKATVAYRVKGTSMVDSLIDDGDYVLVRPNAAQPGEVVVVWVPDRGTVVKVKRKKHYASANERQPRDPIPNDGCKEYGVLVGVIRKC